MDTRGRILLAARDVFGKKGFYEAKMEDIAREAGMGKGTLYLYFRSKEELYQCLLVEGMRYLIDRLKEIISSEGTFEDKMRRIIRFLNEFLQENKEFVLRMVYEAPLVGIFNEKMKEIFTKEQKEINEVFTDFIEDYIKQGVIYDGNPKVMAQAIVGIVMRPAFTGFLQSGNLADLEEEIMGIIKRAFIIKEG